ncbi:restriction endonuclease subunit S [Thioclava sp. FR2]|uniref:restriction endonuclease subunit S n=1 Tax=Thioclava sp. FR2 TaxID=3445780 RepID=UPI003EBC1C7A
MSGLPQGWAKTTLGEIASLRGEKTSPASVPEAPFIGLEDIEPNTSRILKVGKASDVKSSVAVFSAGDVLYSRLRPYLNKVAVAEFDGVASAEILVMRPTEATTAEFIRRRIMTQEFLDFAALLDKGDRPRVNYTEISRFPINLPPLREQKRIVAKVDGLIARTSRARTDLDRIPTLIARYKQRLLALAFSGELTGGKHGWKEASIGDVAHTQLGKMLDKAKNRGLSTKYLRNINVRWYDFQLEDVLEMPMSKEERLKFDIRDGDVLVCEGGEPGRSAVWSDGATDLAFQKALIRVRPKKDSLLPIILVHYLRHLSDTKKLEAHFTGSTIKHLPQRALQSIELSLPPLSQQVEIAQRIASAFNWLDRMAADHAAASNLLPKLDAAILAKAFRGELVPQDPNDEPASALLTRINAKEAVGGARRRRMRDILVKPLGPFVVTNLRLESTEETVMHVKPIAGASAMTKSRQDDDVMGKPYLANLLKAGHGASAQDLFKAADLPVADFYKQLAWEVAQKHIRDDDEKLEAL